VVAGRAQDGQGKFAGYRPTFNHCAMQPTKGNADLNFEGIINDFRWAKIAILNKSIDMIFKSQLAH